MKTFFCDKVKTGSSRVFTTEPRLLRRKKVRAVKMRIKLRVNNFFQEFAYTWKDRDRSIIIRILGGARFKKRNYISNFKIIGENACLKG